MLPDPFIGVYFSLSDAIAFTAVRIFKENIPETTLEMDGNKIWVRRQWKPSNIQAMKSRQNTQHNSNYVLSVNDNRQ